MTFSEHVDDWTWEIGGRIERVGAVEQNPLWKISDSREQLGSAPWTLFEPDGLDLDIQLVP